jgi:hypothetical protein
MSHISRWLGPPPRNRMMQASARIQDDYELRVGDLRVLYRAEKEEGVTRVIVALIGKKKRNKLIIEGKEFEL